MIVSRNVGVVSTQQGRFAEPQTLAGACPLLRTNDLDASDVYVLPEVAKANSFVLSSAAVTLENGPLVTKTNTNSFKHEFLC